MGVTLAIAHLDPAAVPADDPSIVPFVLLHGFTQNAACLEPFAQSLAEAVQGTERQSDVVMVDAPGHGESHHDAADLVDAAGLVIEAGGDGHYVGYSMGGRMLLHAALLHPDRFRSLTLIGATAGIDDPVERAQRLVADERLARRLERDGLPSFLDHWLGLDLFATLPPESAMRDQRLRNRVEGLTASLRNCGTGNQYPLWSRLGQIEVPIQVIAGQADTKFTEIGRRMVDALPNARFEPVPGGHAVHSEHPETVAALVARFSAAVDDARTVER